MQAYCAPTFQSVLQRARLVMSSHVRDEGKTVADAMESVLETAADTGRAGRRRTSMCTLQKDAATSHPNYPSRHA